MITNSNFLLSYERGNTYEPSRINLCLSPSLKYTFIHIEANTQTIKICFETNQLSQFFSPPFLERGDTDIQYIWTMNNFFRLSPSLHPRGAVPRRVWREVQEPRDQGESFIPRLEKEKNSFLPYSSPFFVFLRKARTSSSW